MIDPLHLERGSASLNNKDYRELCNDKEDEDWKGYELNKIAQQIQNDWFGHWIAQMVRIAKPGAPIILEQVAFPLCDNYDDWGGVSQPWWFRAIDTYGWDIDPDSIEFEQEALYQGRYHAFMRKNFAPAPP
jgi:hypothetical protein